MTSPGSLAAVVLAAGKGTRMGSDRAKVLHELGGRPLVYYPVKAARDAGAQRVVVVVGHQRDEVRAAVRGSFGNADWLDFGVQDQQLGTGHAVLCGMPPLQGFEGPVLLMSGDVPLVTVASLTALRGACQHTPAGLAVASFRPEDKTGYGRMLRSPAGNLVAIREERDCDETQRATDECNSGLYCALAQHLRSDLPRIGRDNAQNEIYLTDLVALGAERGPVGSIELPTLEAAGVNTPAQLAELEAHLP